MNEPLVFETLRSIALADLFFRAFLGLGAKASITPLLCAEVSPKQLRGGLLINWQFFDACK